MTVKKKFLLNLSAIIVWFVLSTSSLIAATTFTDLPSTHWAYESVMYLAERGIISGLPDGSFNGNNAMTRYQTSVAMKRLADYLQGSMPSAPSQVSDAGIRELEELVKSALRAVESAGRDYRELQSALENQAAVGGQMMVTPDVSYDFEIEKLEESIKVLEKKTDRNSTSFETNHTKIQSLRTDFDEAVFEQSKEHSQTQKQLDELTSQVNVLRWTAIGGIVVGVIGVVTASFALGK